MDWLNFLKVMAIEESSTATSWPCGLGKHNIILNLMRMASSPRFRGRTALRRGGDAIRIKLRGQLAGKGLLVSSAVA